MNARLGTTSTKAKSFDFYWTQELRKEAIGPIQHDQ